MAAHGRQITYSERLYKYELQHDWEFLTQVQPPAGPAAVDGEWIILDPDGLIRLRARYQWDGPSGPTIDTTNFMRGSLVHDGLYQLLRDGQLGDPGDADWERYRKLADLELVRICELDGMSWARREIVYRGLRWFGAQAAKPPRRHNARCAPKDCVITDPPT